MRAIVVDDRQVGIDLVKKRGNNNTKLEIIEGFRGPNKALEFVRQEREKIDIFFLDVRMPDMPGTRLAIELLSIHRHRRAKIVFLSSYEDVQNDFSTDVYFLPKPFEQSKFDTIIDLIEEKMPKPIPVDDTFIMAETNEKYLRRYQRNINRSDEIITYDTDGRRDRISSQALSNFRKEDENNSIFSPYRGHIVNIAHITAIINEEYLVMFHKYPVPISHDKLNKAKQAKDIIEVKTLEEYKLELDKKNIITPVDINDFEKIYTRLKR